MKQAEIREIFYDYFRKQSHYKVLSAPLIPAKDPTLLFTNAGMNQFKSVFLQEEIREYKRAVSIQKCMRVSGKHNDFDEVGKTNYHHTFFEMMGNFSFGDYFKEEAIRFGWELLTEHYKFNPDQLTISVFETDDEAYKIWEKEIGIPSSRLFRLGEKDNFWQMGDTGPCGPCSEIHFDKGDAYGPPDLEHNSSRYIEIWNLVFMQYFKDPKGVLSSLPAPSIDTGMGLERLSSLLQGVESNYQTDLFRPIIEFTAAQAGVSPDDPVHRVDLNVIADHIRALSFLIADGVLPANDGRGYVLRRLLRRAAKHGKSLGFNSSFLHSISTKVIDIMKPAYPELEYNRGFISEVILAEEERFDRTLLVGLKKFDELVERLGDSEDKTIPGSELFKLSDTYGFPIDFARDLANEKDITIDYSGYQKALEEQREKSRVSLSKQQKSIRALEGIDELNTVFTGYQTVEDEATLKAIYISDKKIQEIEVPDNSETPLEALLVFDKTPFYAESGGQVGDTGTAHGESSFVKITDTRKAGNKVFLHFAQIKKGRLAVGDRLRLAIDKERRQKIAVHHSTTHMLHSALREILGLHVKQAGSYVGPDKLRFDFTHFKGLSPEDLNQIERLVNTKIRENLPVKTQELPYEEAIERGAIAIFEEKYSDWVRMIELEEYSKELCGGTHLDYTGQAGIFKITNESSISSGIRRIEAIAGETAYNFIDDSLKVLGEIQQHFSQKQENVLEFLLHMEHNYKKLERNLKKVQHADNKPDLKQILQRATEMGNVKTVVEVFDGLDRKDLSTLADEIKRNTNGLSVLVSNIEGKSAIVVSVFQDLTQTIDANKIIREISALVGGKGGGRKDFAQAGGDLVENADTFIEKVKEILKNQIDAS